MAAKKATLRQLVVASGLRKPNDMTLFQISLGDIVKILEEEGGAEYKGVGDLDEEAVQDLIAAAEKGDAKDDKEEPRGRGRAAAKDEPEEKPRGRGRAAAAKDDKEEPRGRGRAAEPEEEPRGRGRAAAKDEPEEKPRGRGRSAEPEEPKEEPRGRGRAAAKDEPEEKPRGRGRAAEPEEKREVKEEPRTGRGRAAEPEEVKADSTVKLLEEVLDSQIAMGKALAGIEKSLAELDAKVDALDANTTKTLKATKAQLAEVHVGVESIYLNDISAKDKDLAAVLKRVQG